MSGRTQYMPAKISFSSFGFSLIFFKKLFSELTIPKLNGVKIFTVATVKAVSNFKEKL